MIPLFASTCLVQLVGVTTDSFSRFSMAVRPDFTDFALVWFLHETSPALANYPSVALRSTTANSICIPQH